MTKPSITFWPLECKYSRIYIVLEPGAAHISRTEWWDSILSRVTGIIDTFSYRKILPASTSSTMNLCRLLSFSDCLNSCLLSSSKQKHTSGTGYQLTTWGYFYPSDFKISMCRLSSFWVYCLFALKICLANNLTYDTELILNDTSRGVWSAW